MIGIGVATAAAGIIVGTVSLTGVGLVMTEVVELLSGGNLIVMLLLVAVISLILGMGLPTTANYIVVSTLMAPVVVELGAQNGLLVPLIAVHLFVFYFGLMADVTPPVGPGLVRRRGHRARRPDQDRRHGLLLQHAHGDPALPVHLQHPVADDRHRQRSFHLALTVGSAVVAMLVFAAATQGYFLVRSRWYESVALLLVTFTLFRPGFWWDMVYPPYEQVPGDAADGAGREGARRASASASGSRAPTSTARTSARACCCRWASPARRATVWPRSA